MPIQRSPFLHTVRAIQAFVFGVVATCLIVTSNPSPPTCRRSDCRRARPIGPVPPRRWRGANGQATTEYALILLAAALVGLLVVAWATAGGAAGRIGQLFDSVVDSVISRL